MQRSAPTVQPSKSLLISAQYPTEEPVLAAIDLDQGKLASLLDVQHGDLEARYLEVILESASQSA